MTQQQQKRQTQSSLLKRIFDRPCHAELDHELKNIKSRAIEVNDVWLDRCNKALYHDLYMDWLDACLASPNMHPKQLAVCWFLLTDEKYRAYVCECEGDTRRFNKFLRKLEVYVQNMVYGVQICDGSKYTITDAASRPQDTSYHCGHLAILIANMVNSSYACVSERACATYHFLVIMESNAHNSHLRPFSSSVWIYAYVYFAYLINILYYMLCSIV